MGFPTDEVAVLNTEEAVDKEKVIAKFRDCLTSAGFDVPNLSLSVEARQVFRFRNAEFALPLADTNQYGVPYSSSDIDGVGPECLDQVEPHEVLVMTSRSSHNSGDDYDHRLLAVPRGSSLPEGSKWYHEEVFAEDINHMGGMDSNSDTTIDLPEGARFWNGAQWVPIEKLEYHY